MSSVSTLLQNAKCLYFHGSQIPEHNVACVDKMLASKTEIKDSREYRNEPAEESSSNIPKEGQMKEEEESGNENLDLGLFQNVIRIFCCMTSVDAAFGAIFIIFLLNLVDVASDFGLVYYLYENKVVTEISSRIIIF